MKDSDMQLLHQIKTWCEDVAELIERFGSEYEIFLRDKAYFHSVSMCLQQIGELTGRLSDEFKDSTKSKIRWSAIKGMRNWFAHAYAEMNEEAIFMTATKDIPSLMSFCDQAMREGVTD